MYLRQIFTLCVLLLPGAGHFNAAAPGRHISFHGLPHISFHGLPPEARPPQSSASASELLASYVDWIEGRRKSVELITVNLDEVRHDLARLAPGFLKPGSKPSTPGEVERRRRLLTTFALEVAAAGASRHAPAAARLVEWACPYVRSHTPLNDFDRAWQLAALAVLEGGIDADTLAAHVDHTQPLFSDEPRLRLARAIVDEQSTAPAEVMYLQTAAIEPIAAARGTDALRRQGERARASERAITGFRNALKDETLRAEASLRLGHVQLGMRRYDAALASWAEVEQLTGDRSLIYLVRLFRGLALDRLAGSSAHGDPVRSGETTRKAKAAYLQALDVSPGAHSATMSLAALMFRHGRTDDPDRLLETLLKDNDPRRDPWWSYYGADWRFWYPRIARVRTLLTNAPVSSGDQAIEPSREVASPDDPIERSPDPTSTDELIAPWGEYAETALAPGRVPSRSGPGQIPKESGGSPWGLTPDGPPDGPDSQEVFRSGVDGVTIQAYVRRGTRPVAGLSAADFDLRDNGVAQQLTTVSIERVPVDLTLLLDVSASVDGPMLQRLKNAVRDTAALLRQGDRIRLVAVSQVLTEIFSLRPRGQTLPLDGLVAQGATSLYDGLAATMMRASEPGRRQLVVAFTDGRDSTSIIDEDTAKEIARLTDTVVDIVVPVWDDRRGDAARTPSNRGRGSLPAGGNVVFAHPLEMADPARAQPGTERDAVAAVLTELIGPTAGQVFTLGPKDSISQVFKRMLDEFRASYVLHYVPRGVTAAGWHDVTVGLKTRGPYEIRARKGYQGR